MGLLFQGSKGGRLIFELKTYEDNDKIGISKMYNDMLKNINDVAVINNEYFRSDGTAMEVVNIVLNNYKIDIYNPDFGSIPEEVCYTIIFQIIVELRHIWSVALECYQENFARDCKKFS